MIPEVGVGMCNIEVGLDASTHTQLGRAAKLSQRAFCHAVQLDVLIDFMCHLLIRLLGRVNTVKNVLPDVVELGIASAM